MTRSFHKTAIAILVLLTTSSLCRGQLVVPTWSPYSVYPPPYFWNNWNGGALFNPYRGPSVVNNTIVPVPMDNRRETPPPEPPPKIETPALPATPLSAPTYVMRWTPTGRFPIVGFVVGTDGPTAVTLDVNGRRQTLRVGDEFVANNITYRVMAISPNAVNLVAQQQITVR